MSDERANEGGLLVHLFGPPPQVDGVPEAAPREGFCWPHWPLVDKVSRIVTCKRCESELDPVDVLLQVAERHDDYVRVAEETRTLRKQLEQLHAEEKRLKARMKAHSRKDAAAAVAAEREKIVNQFYEIVRHARDVSRAGMRIEELLTGKRGRKC